MYLYLYHSGGPQAAERPQNTADPPGPCAAPKGEPTASGGTPESRSALSERLSRQALSDYAARKGLGFAAETLRNAAIEKGAMGKPCFAGLPSPQVHYSVSHSGPWWGCLMAAEPVGFDLEVRREGVSWEKIARRFFTEAERALVLAGGPDAFFDVWVRKEACVKYLGSGLARSLSAFSVAEDGGFSPQVTLDPGHLRCAVRPCKVAGGVKAAYCCAGDSSPEGILWLSDIPNAAS
jgi:phosphopantetheinyl transferase